jgi:hypothetical protein
VTDSKAPTLEETVALIDKGHQQAATMLEKIFAAIAIGPDGVRIKPVVDLTKVAPAGLTAWATMLGLLRARRRARDR